MADMIDAPYRVIVAQRVGEEFQVSAECRSQDREVMLDTIDAVLGKLTEHRDAHNQKVIEIHERRVKAVVERTEKAGEECRRLEAERDKLIAEVAALKARKDRRLQSA